MDEGKKGFTFDDLEKTNTRTPSEIMAAMIDALVVAVHGRLISGEAAAQVAEITEELLHWAFLPEGRHNRPADLIAVGLAMRSDLDTVKDKDGKPKLDA